MVICLKSLEVKNGVKRFEFKVALNSETLKLADPEASARKLGKYLIWLFKAIGADGFFITISGGVDSALTFILVVKAVRELADGKIPIRIMFMPNKISDTKQNRRCISKLIELAKEDYDIDVEYSEVNIVPITESFGGSPILARILWSRRFAGCIYRNYYTFSKACGKDLYRDTLLGSKNRFTRGKNASAKIPHGIRLIMAIYEATKENEILIGCANLTEFLIGFYSFGGVDHISHIMLIGDLYKTQVYQLAKYLNLPQEIIDRKAASELATGITDEFANGGIPFEILDLSLYGCKNSMSTESISSQIPYSLKEVERVKGLVKIAAIQAEMPYTPKI